MRQINCKMAHDSSDEKKGFFDSLVDNVKHAGGAVVDGVGKVGSLAVSGVKSAGSAVGDVAGKAVDAGKVRAQFHPYSYNLHVIFLII